MQLNRRNILRGLIAAPAVVAAGSLMPISARNVSQLMPWQSEVLSAIEVNNRFKMYAGGRGGGKSALLTIDMITREAIELFVNSNKFIEQLDKQYDEVFADAKVGSMVRVRLPVDYEPKYDTVQVMYDDEAMIELAEKRFAEVEQHAERMERAIAQDMFYTHGEQWVEMRRQQKEKRHLVYNKDRRTIEQVVNDELAATGRSMVRITHEEVAQIDHPLARTGHVPALLEVGAPVAIAAAAAVVVEKNPVVSRRFWGRK